MWRLGLLMYTIASVVVMAILMVLSLVMGRDGGDDLKMMSIWGFVAAVPASYLMAYTVSRINTH